MGSSPSAHIAYGYALGNNERLEFQERDGEYGSDLTVDWWVSYDPDDDGEQDVPEASRQIYSRLFEAIPDAPAVQYDWEMDDHVEAHFGVTLAYPGASESSGYVLIAVGSERSVDWDEVMPLSLAVMQQQILDNGWLPKLAKAIEALGLTPIQDEPNWLVFPSYG